MSSPTVARLTKSSLSHWKMMALSARAARPGGKHIPLLLFWGLLVSIDFTDKLSIKQNLIVHGAMPSVCTRSR